jgi:hypothetical protein
MQVAIRDVRLTSKWMKHFSVAKEKHSISAPRENHMFSGAQNHQFLCGSETLQLSAIAYLCKKEEDLNK